MRTLVRLRLLRTPSERFLRKRSPCTAPVRPPRPPRPAPPARLLSPAASCCSVLASSAWLAFCVASCSKFQPTLPPGHFRAGAQCSGFFFRLNPFSVPSAERKKPTVALRSIPHPHPQRLFRSDEVLVASLFAALIRTSRSLVCCLGPS